MGILKIILPIFALTFACANDDLVEPRNVEGRVAEVNEVAVNQNPMIRGEGRNRDAEISRQWAQGIVREARAEELGIPWRERVAQWGALVYNSFMQRGTLVYAIGIFTPVLYLHQASLIYSDWARDDAFGPLEICCISYPSICSDIYSMSRANFWLLFALFNVSLYAEAAGRTPFSVERLARMRDMFHSLGLVL